MNCSKPQTSSEYSFYYWRTTFHLCNFEREFLSALNVKKLYVRFFDIGVDCKSGLAAPISPICISERESSFTIVPVIYIKNSVFQCASAWVDDSLALKVVDMIHSISTQFCQKTEQIQIDCDWTEGTKKRYFLFLRKLSFYEADSCQITSTIRLHQIKYSAIMGIPPVKQVSVMLYNMNSPSMDTTCSIYDHKTALRYIPSLKNYPLKIDIALPVFSWGIHSRGKRIIALYSKYSKKDALLDTVLAPVNKNLFRVRKSHFYLGHYFKQDDLIKIEETDHRQCTEALKACRRIRSLHSSNIIFYDLDSLNLQRISIEVFNQIRN